MFDDMQEADMWAEALKLAQMHLPHRVGEVSAAYQSSQARASAHMSASCISSNIISH